MFVGGILLASIAGGLLFAVAQQNFANSTFEFGKTTEFQGRLVKKPYPSLIVTTTLEDNHTDQKPFLLVAPGKHGATPLIEGFTERNIRLRGALIHREEGQMIEVVPGSITQAAEAPRETGATRRLGGFTLRGEIVDSKCFLGVMNPGEGKVHRDCAVRCISGGIPPAFLTSDLTGKPQILLLSGENGRPLDKEAYLYRVAQPVQIHGQVLEVDGLLYLQFEPAQVAALP